MLFLLPSKICGQESNQLNEMIIESINIYTEFRDSLISQSFNKTDTYKYYMCRDGFIAEFPFDSMANITFFSLINIEGLPKYFKKELSKGITALFLDIKIIHNQLIITISNRWVRRNKINDMHISLSDWYIVKYEYSLDKQKWTLTEKEYGGL